MNLNIGQEFCKDPAGRYFTDGKGNGEEFRERFLLPRLESLEKGEKIVIVLDDDVGGYGSSFLSEGFAGVVKYGYMSAEELLPKLEFQFSDQDFEFFKNRIIEYISKAKFASKDYVPSE